MTSMTRRASDSDSDAVFWDILKTTSRSVPFLLHTTVPLFGVPSTSSSSARIQRLRPVQVRNLFPPLSGFVIGVHRLIPSLLGYPKDYPPRHSRSPFEPSSFSALKLRVEVTSIGSIDILVASPHLGISQSLTPGPSIALYSKAPNRRGRAFDTSRSHQRICVESTPQLGQPYPPQHLPIPDPSLWTRNVHTNRPHHNERRRSAC